MRYDDENNPLEPDENDRDEYEGYAVVDDEGNELAVSRNTPKKKNEENWDDGETVEASPIPENEQTVMIDNADVSHLEAGAALTLVFSGTTASLFDGEVKAGDLKPAFVTKLLEARKGMHVSCELFSAASPVMVKLKFYARARKNTVRIS